MYQLKVMLNDIVDRAFMNDPKLKSYKAFYIEVLNKDYKGRNGDYNPNTRHIRLMNTYRDEKKLVVTAIHELAHHINHMQGNTDIHGDGFYSNYKKLLYTALDMNLFDKDEYIALVKKNRDSSSENKVVKMIRDYESKDVGYKKDIIKFTIFGGFDIRETLKSKGYKFNKIGKAWEKEVREIDKTSEEEWLTSQNIKYKITDANQYIVKSEEQKEKQKKRCPKITFRVYNSYEIRNTLRELGMHYNSEQKAWQFQVELTEDAKPEAEHIKDELCGLNIPFVKRRKNTDKQLCCTITYEQ